MGQFCLFACLFVCLIVFCFVFCCLFVFFWSVSELANYDRCGRLLSMTF